MYVAKTKALISFTVTAKLICIFVYTYANCWFPHDVDVLFYFFYLFTYLIYLCIYLFIIFVDILEFPSMIVESSNTANI